MKAALLSLWSVAQPRWAGALALLVAAPAATPLHGEPTPAPPPGYTLVWSDEFEREGAPDPTKWGFENGFARNRELQWYQAENARCEGGLLVIAARRESRPNPRHEAGSRDWRKARAKVEYTSASVTTRGLHSWLYGRIEVRARIDVRPGMWPAIWTLGVEGRWPANGEVDIMEYYKGEILANAFWGKVGSHQPASDVVRKPLGKFPGPHWADAFHVWRMDWDEKEIALYIDDELINRIPIMEKQRLPGQPHPFQQPHYLLLNLAVGANGGDPTPTKFPARFEVDYVRVYQQLN